MTNSPASKHRRARGNGFPSSVLLIFLCLLFMSAAQAGAGDKSVSVTELKHWSSPTYTRVAITLTGKSSFTHHLLKKDPAINKPRRLVIDITGAGLGKDLQKELPINDGLLKVARAGQFDKSTVRVVLDIESIEDYKVFTLDEPFKIIIDVTGEKPSAKNGAAAIATPAPKPPAMAPNAAVAVPHAKTRQIKIVIDPGHGGKDPGAIGKGGLKEKDVTLRLARMLRDRLNEKLSSSRLIMTRDSDVFIPLEERTAIANKNDADLFVSIHINSSPRPVASGVETYMLSVSKDEESRRLAARENGTSRKALSDLEFILNDLTRTAKTNDSIRLATFVQERLAGGLQKKFSGVKGNGVKGAPFYVLVGTKMPAILVEVSFVSNPMEEKRLRDDKYLKEAIEGISTGLMQYISGAGIS